MSKILSELQIKRINNFYNFVLYDLPEVTGVLSFDFFEFIHTHHHKLNEVHSSDVFNKTYLEAIDKFAAAFREQNPTVSDNDFLQFRKNYLTTCNVSSVLDRVYSIRAGAVGAENKSGLSLG